jgi:GMP synthase (glutamine-hydrolysing)
MKPLLIIKTGKTVQTAYAKAGDFEKWIIDGMEANTDACTVVEVYEGEKLPAIEDICGAVITGSPAMVTDRLDWSEYTAAWLREAISKQVPVLGICYGHQLLAHALGGRVDYHPKGREIGTTVVTPLKGSESDILFADIAEPFTVHVSHMQSVMELPPAAQILASNDFDAFHAVRFSDLCWGMQFHPEFEEVAMRSYIEERQQDLRNEGLDVEALLAGIEATPVARKILADFYQIATNN